MIHLINSKEEKKLKEFLALAPTPDATLSYQELLGYIFGVAITPEVIDPNEWIPVIFGEEMPEYESEDQARELMANLLSVLNKHIGAFHQDDLFLPFDMENLVEKDVENVCEWTSGFEEALSLRPECWEEQEGLTEEEQDHLMNSLIVVEGIVYPEEAIDMFEHMSEEELGEMGIVFQGDALEQIVQVQMFMLQALDLSISTIQGHARKLDLERQKKVRQSTSPFPVRSSKVGMKKECPCGSGKIYIDCCGKTNGEVGTGGTRSGRNKVIEVDFRKKRKSDKKGKTGSSITPFLQRKSLSCYQLEITLAGTEPEIKRRIRVHSQMNLADFHLLLQYVMGWQDFHMHHFQAGLKFYGPQVSDDYAEKSFLDESRFTLYDLESDLLQGIVYTYDLGDDWEHVILLENVLPESEYLGCPQVLEAEGACPPEDIGGIPGFIHFLEVLNNPEHADRGEYEQIPGLLNYSQSDYDIEAMNELLKHLYGQE